MASTAEQKVWQFYTRSDAVAAILITILYVIPRGAALGKTFRYRFDGAMVKNILKIGVPNGLENSMFQLGKFLY